MALDLNLIDSDCPVRWQWPIRIELIPQLAHWKNILLQKHWPNDFTRIEVQSDLEQKRYSNILFLQDTPTWLPEVPGKPIADLIFIIRETLPITKNEREVIEEMVKKEWAAGIFIIQK